MTDITDIDIRPHELLAAQAPDLATITKLDAKTPTINTPKSTSSQSNVGGGDPDAPRQTTAQTEFDRKLAEVIEASNAGVEHRQPNFPQQPAAPLDPETARLNEEFNAAVEGRKPNFPVESSTTPTVDENGETQYNDSGIIDVQLEERKSESSKHSLWYEKKKTQLQKNKQQGDDFEKEAEITFEATHLYSQKQITIRTANKTRIRVDFIGYDPKTEKIVIVEAKSSPTARFTNNQIKGFPDLMKEGGVVVGKGKGKFEGGTIIPAQTEIYVRRPNEYKLYGEE